jgi:hypothetical protein
MAKAEKVAPGSDIPLRTADAEVWLQEDKRRWSLQHTMRASAGGSPTLGMLVKMLVEEVFLVSGVVKTVFWRFKKK